VALRSTQRRSCPQLMRGTISGTQKHSEALVSSADEGRNQWHSEALRGARVLTFHACACER
jgi:hypothetical protein